MGLSDRIGMVVKSSVNALVTAAEDPEKILEQVIIDMQEDLTQLRQAVAQSMAALKRQEQQYNQAATQAEEWTKRAMLALQKGDEGLAKEALSRKKTHVDTAATLKVSLDSQTAQVDTLKKNLMALEGKIAEIKTKKEILKARMQSAKAKENLNNTVGKINNPNSAAETFKRMEELMLLAEAKASSTCERDFDDIEAGSNVDAELEAMKAQLAASKAPALPLTDSPRSGPSVGSVIDAELEALRRQMGK